MTRPILAMQKNPCGNFQQALPTRTAVRLDFAFTRAYVHRKSVNLA